MNPNETIRDPNWRLTHLYKIVNKNAEAVTFSPNTIQSRLNRNPAKKKLILKARQLGISTNELIKMFDFVAWNRNVTACILAHENDGIEKLFRIPRRAHDFMGELYKPELDRGGGSKYEMFFPKLNSRIYCDLESRGDTIHWLHISEAAFADPDRIKSTMQTVPLNGIITIETTANGIGNFFHDLWHDKAFQFERIFYPWFMHDEYKIAGGEIQRTDDEIALAEAALRRYGIALTDDQFRFRRAKQGELKREFIQEYPEDEHTCFLTTGNPAIDHEAITRAIQDAPKPMRVVGPIKIYSEPKTDGVYIIGADCAEGVGGDFSAASVIDAKRMIQVATLHCDEKPSDFAKLLVRLASFYRPRGTWPKIAVERNNHGHAVLLSLDETLHYSAIYSGPDERPGWKTDAISRPLMINALRDGIEDGRLIVQDSDTLEECLTLVNNSGKIEAAKGKHDDRVISLAIALQVAIDEAKLGTLYDNIASKILV